MIEINLTTTIFPFCVVVAGILLTIGVDEVLGGFLDVLRALWQAAAGALQTHDGDVTIRAPRDRARSSGRRATPTH